MASFGLFEQSAPASPFAGAAYDAERDEARLTRQIDCIRTVALTGEWWTIEQLTAACRKQFPAVRFPENSVQAQLRNLRKLGYRVERANLAEKGCLHAYKVQEPVNPGVGRALRGEVSHG